MSNPLLNLPPIQVTPRPTVEHGRRVTCSCGESFRLDSTEENDHYVWALAWEDITRRIARVSNLGYCPITDGFDVAVRRARAGFGLNPAYYRGEVCR